MENVIELNNIHKIYRVGDIDIHALRGITLNINAGEFVSVMGPSGSGKSTLMNIMGCLDKPSSGNYILEGKDISVLTKDELAEIRNKKIGFVFQNFSLLPRATALENVELPLLYDGTSSNKRSVLANDTLNALGLGGRENHFPTQLSGGQQQRVAIARAIINKPSIILADEPTGNLDTKMSQEIMEVFKALNEQGRTIVMITHEPSVAEYAKRVIKISDGMIMDEIIS
ncbi:MAG: ABC transporter ATP-binding protein [Thermodesulfobacteriota bacterium]